MESEKPTTDNGADGNRRASVARAEGVTIRQQVKTALAGGAAQRETRRAVLALALPLVGSDLLQRGVNVVDRPAGRAAGGRRASCRRPVAAPPDVRHGAGVRARRGRDGHGGVPHRRDGQPAPSPGGPHGPPDRGGRHARPGLQRDSLLVAGGEIHGADGRLLELTLDYLHVTWFLFAAYVYLHLMSAIFQGVGDTRTPLKAMVGVNVLHVLLAFP